MREITRSDTTLYYYAISCALSALSGYAEKWGRGWYHFSDGQVIIALDLAAVSRR